MKKNYFLSILLIVFGVSTVLAQSIVSKQLIVASGGNYSNPDDYVTVASFNLEDSTGQFGTIFTQSVQDAVIYRNYDEAYVYVAAQDSIVAYNIETYQRVAAVEAVGVNKLAVTDDKVVASFWYPNTSDFVKIYNREDLSLIANIEGISGDCSGIVVYGDYAFVAVPGPYGSTTGGLAVINMTDNTLFTEVNLGEEAARISDIYFYQEVKGGIAGNYLITVNQSAWGENTGYITKINLDDYSITHSQVDVSLGKGVGLDLNADVSKLYAVINGGIGAISLNNLEVSDTTVVAAPSMTIADAVFDFARGRFYVTTTDYVSTGAGIVYDMNGDSINNFEAGISAEALAVDYYGIESVEENKADNFVSVYPNPVNDVLNLTYRGNNSLQKAVVRNIAGQVVETYDFNGYASSATIDVSTLNSGMYLVSVYDKNGVNTVKIFKK